MTDVTPSLNALLRQKQVAPVSRHRYSVDQLDDFLKEAYKINARIADLTAYLKANRTAYLSTTSASRLARHDSARGQKPGSAPQRPLTDQERAEIDAHSKTMIRQLNGAITGLADAEKIRQETTALVASRKRNRAGLGALGRWAAGGAAQEKTPNEELQEAKEKSLNAHREGVIWFLQKRLGEAGQMQAFMIESRLQREEEKAKSVLYKAKGTDMMGEKVDPNLLPHRDGAGLGTNDLRMLPDDIDQQLTDEQVQMFAEENQGMLKHLGQQLDQVRTVHRSLEEISQLQTSLMANLETQNANIDQLVQDSFFTEENVGKGNKQLKKASEKTSTARLLFHGTCAFCTFLVVWDLIF
ncbi:snare protein syntaxin-like protein 18/UFE1 [Myriangium duriaei CBS 260.36]|uniref:Snare protein syntaxin-like protein 18/UFE1 n=1 Tax=Myriangium duriaei CBS 260.36 TaxID=1168546 RepID=A0A9P4MJA8_9PEZI|nr:snare protein syntaxin-like protein 18/UFE1 [Myriangium duriaei CBS 260.36]